MKIIRQEGCETVFPYIAYIPDNISGNPALLIQLHGAGERGGGGEDLESISKFSKILGNYSGERTDLHKKLISEDFYNNSKEIALDYYLKFVDKGADNSVFEIPMYNY